MKIVINACHGGFSLSPKATKRLAELQGKKIEEIFFLDINRDDPLLIQVIEELKYKANGMCAELKIVEIPDDVEWEIDEYDGLETIHEVHRSWS